MEEELTRKLEDLARKMRAWAVESKQGGWSTHLVDRLRKEADRIDELLATRRQEHEVFDLDRLL